MAEDRFVVPAGEDAELMPGDFILVHGDHFTSKLIRFGQSLRFRGARRGYASWNHAALFIGKGCIAEALGNGVVVDSLTKYTDREYIAVRIEADLPDRGQIIDFSDSVIAARWKYGYLTIAGLFFTLAIGSTLTLGQNGTAICSGFVAAALTRAGYIFKRDPAYMMPADLAEHFEVAGRP